MVAAIAPALAVRSNGNGPRGQEPETPRVLICYLCSRRIYPEREGAPANADVRAHAKCAER